MDERIKLIELINQDLILHGKEQITVSDFDILIDLELPELIHAREQVRAYLKESSKGSEN